MRRGIVCAPRRRERARRCRPVERTVGRASRKVVPSRKVSVASRRRSRMHDNAPRMCTSVRFSGLHFVVKFSIDHILFCILIVIFEL